MQCFWSEHAAKCCVGVFGYNIDYLVIYDKGINDNNEGKGVVFVNTEFLRGIFPIWIWIC